MPNLDTHEDTGADYEQEQKAQLGRHTELPCSAAEYLEGFPLSFHTDDGCENSDHDTKYDNNIGKATFRQVAIRHRNFNDTASKHHPNSQRYIIRLSRLNIVKYKCSNSKNAKQRLT